MLQRIKQQPALHGQASRSTARKMIASAQMARPFVQAALVVDKCITEQVTMQVAMEDLIVGGIRVREDSVYYLVESRKWAHNFYVVVLGQDGRYQCSSREEKVIAWAISKVVQFKNQQRAAA